MKKVYTLKTNHDGLIGIYTNKKLVYLKMNSLMENKKGVPSYSKFCKELDYYWHFEEKDESGEYYASNTDYTIEVFTLNR